MKAATKTETKNQLSLLIDTVRKGETVLILDRNVSVARLEPVPLGEDSGFGTHIAELERTGLIRRAQAVYRGASWTAICRNPEMTPAPWRHSLPSVRKADEVLGFISGGAFGN